jgi:hypothetical protein
LKEALNILVVGTEKLANSRQADIHQVRSLGLALAEAASKSPEGLISDLLAAGVAILGSAAVS